MLRLGYVETYTAIIILRRRGKHRMARRFVHRPHEYHGGEDTAGMGKDVTL